MRGDDNNQDYMFSYISPEERVPQDHPLRPIRQMVNQALKDLWPQFKAMYARVGRPSVPPEKLLRALLLQVLYSIRSERLLMEQLDYNLLFRWFVGLSMDEPVWNHSVFSKNRERLIGSDIAAAFFERILQQAKQANLLSDEHFTVDGTLIEAWASLKSFRPKDGGPPAGGGRNQTVDFHGEKRRNDTHASTTDPDARLWRKGRGHEARLCFMGHVLMENKNGFIQNTRLTLATGTSERDTAWDMIQAIPSKKRIRIGADKNYDTQDFVRKLRSRRAVPHVARKRTCSALDNRTTRHATYALSQKLRKKVEEIFGWLKTVGNLRQTRHRGRERVSWVFTFTAAVYNLVRMRNLLANRG